MKIGMVGLGRMGANMARRLVRGGHECIGFDLHAKGVEALEAEKIGIARSLDDLAARTSSPRVVWVMVPAGEPTELAIRDLGGKLSRGDVVIDGGNTFYKDDVRRARELAERGVHHVDVGTSGGVWGLDRGYCLMVGGEKEVVHKLQPIFATLAPGTGSIPRTEGRSGPPASSEEGWLHCGPSGAGHFAKMIHNGIEYGLMQAYAEGLDILRNATSPELAEEHRYRFDLREICELWRRGSVVSSWLLDLTATALQSDPELESMAGVVSDSGEGRWTLMAAIEEAVPANVLSAALNARFRSRRQPTFADKVLSAMRKGFGGHVEPAPPA